MNDDINDGIVKLNIADAELHTYTHIAYLFSILQCKESTYPWIYSNFIQVYMNKNLRDNKWGDFYFPMPYESKPVDFCKWIRISRIRREVFKDDTTRFLNYIIGEIKTGHYVHLVLNHYYLKNDINNMKRYHDTLIYGVDETKHLVYILDIVFLGSLNKITVSYENLIKAFFDYEINKNMSSFDEMILSYGLKEESDFKFDILNIQNSIIDYYNGTTPEYWRLYNNENRSNIVFGINVYDALADYVSYVKEVNGSIDLRQFYLMYEHKKIMLKRFVFLKNNNYYTKECVEYMIYSYTSLYKLSKVLINVLLKYRVSNKIELLDRLRNITLDIKNEEMIILGRYVNDFINHS